LRDKLIIDPLKGKNAKNNAGKYKFHVPVTSDSISSKVTGTWLKVTANVGNVNLLQAK
jgi:hypothetical protein